MGGETTTELSAKIAGIAKSDGQHPKKKPNPKTTPPHPQNKRKNTTKTTNNRVIGLFILRGEKPPPAARRLYIETETKKSGLSPSGREAGAKQSQHPVQRPLAFVGG